MSAPAYTPTDNQPPSPISGAKARVGGSDKRDMLALTTNIVVAYMAHNPVAAERLADTISTVHHSLAGLDQNVNRSRPRPAVPVRRSIMPDYLVCLEDGRRMKMLKRHLRAAYNLTPDEYRRKWGLPASYPMVAPNYAAKQSAQAKKIGLGQHRGRDQRGLTLCKPPAGRQTR